MNDKIIESIIKISNKEQNRLIRSMAKLDTKLRILILKEHIPIFHKLRAQFPDIDDKSILTYCSFILTIKANESVSNSLSYRSMKLRSLKNKDHIKRQKLLSYWAIVTTLRIDEGMSFRDIANYLKKYNKFEVSYSFIYKLWHELEEEKEELDEY